MKPAELRNLTNEELKAKLESIGKELLDIRLKLTHGTVEKPHVFKHHRRDIARIKTILRQNDKS